MTACLVGFALPAVAWADVFVVNRTDDPTPGLCDASHCTLREAVNQAGSSDSITVPAGTYVLSSIGSLALDGDTLNGAGARQTIIDANSQDRVLAADSNSSISGVTIRGGQSASVGGGVYASGTVTITNSHIVGNTAPSGGGLFVPSGGVLTIVASTIAGNTASSSSGTTGGGIASDDEGQTITLINSTVSGNVARDTGPNGARGGGIYAGSNNLLTLSNVTVAGNESSSGGGGGVYVTSGATAAITNTIISDNSGGACAGNVAAIPTGSHHNLVSDGSCALTGPGNVQGVSAQIVGLGVHGGPTDTRALEPSSPAINAGSDCTTTDQRGVARPQAGGCDIGAFEYVPPTLTVTTTVVNDDGGVDVPGRFTVHVRDAGNAEVPGSPQPGSATGTTYTLAPGSFTVSADGPGLYALSFGGACSPTGAVSIGEGQSLVCTVDANDRAPVAGRIVNALPKSGTVRVRRPGGQWTVLTGAGQMPNGTRLDTLRGRVTLVAAADRRGNETKADFYDGVFRLDQGRSARPTTTLTLTQRLSCAKAKDATIAQKRKRKRRLWGDGSGRFRTKGKHSAATVVGTTWLVEDRCKATLTRVVRGRVSVRDFVKKKTVTVRRGKRYLARAKR